MAPLHSFMDESDRGLPIPIPYIRRLELGAEAQNAASAPDVAERQRQAGRRLMALGLLCGSVWGFLMVLAVVAS